MLNNTTFQNGNKSENLSRDERVNKNAKAMLERMRKELEQQHLCVEFSIIIENGCGSILGIEPELGYGPNDEMRKAYVPPTKLEELSQRERDYLSARQFLENEKQPQLNIHGFQYGTARYEMDVLAGVGRLVLYEYDYDHDTYARKVTPILSNPKVVIEGTFAELAAKHAADRDEFKSNITRAEEELAQAKAAYAEKEAELLADQKARLGDKAPNGKERRKVKYLLQSLQKQVDVAEAFLRNQQDCMKQNGHIRG